MTWLGWSMARAGGWPRMLLIAGCTAVCSALLLVAVTILSLPEQPQEVLFNLVSEPGLRVGTAFGTALLTVPVVLLLYQGIRLGTAARERRLAALRVAGATSAQVRRLGAVEVGIPAAAGGVLGIAVYAVLRRLLGGTTVGVPGVYAIAGDAGPGLVPTSVTPTWWQLLAVVLVMAGVGLLTGWRVSGRVLVSPLGVARRQPAKPPRPWGLLALVLSPLVLLASFDDASDLGVIAAVALAVLGMVSLSSWGAYRIGRFAESRATSAATLLAARRLVTEPRPAGRAAAAVGGIALVAGGTAGLVADLRAQQGPVDSFYTISILLVAAALLVGLVAATATLAVHSVESLFDRRRAVAALAATGTPGDVLATAQRREAALVALPMAVCGFALGALAVGAFTLHDTAGLAVVAAGAGLVVGLTWAALHIATQAVRPWLARTARPGNLRTE